MSIKQVQISVDDLTLGMFVSRLDRPWGKTPFPLQGFQVRSLDEIVSLRTFCDYVYIDIVKGKGPLEYGEAGLRSDRRSNPARSAKGDRRRLTRTGNDEGPGYTPITVRKGVYEITVPLRVEAENARNIVRHLRGNLSLVSRQISRGKLADYEKLKQNVNGMVESVLRCPDAFTWLVRLREKDQHTHDHSLRSALWAVQFARFIGLDKEEISVLCMGALLKDIGKIKVSNAVLRKQNRSEAEEHEYRSYVLHGVEMLRNTRQVEPRIISIVRYHAERHNGQGFPEGVSGTKIPLLARITGIATTYDMISNPRETSQPVAPSRAVSLLYNMRGEEFQEDLIVQFIQSVGLYPTGTLVELTTGDIGVVVEQHPSSRLTPQVAILDQRASDLNKDIFLVDLKDNEKALRILAHHQRGNTQSNDRVAIARDLEPTGYDVDLTNVSTLFMDADVQQKGGLWAAVKAKFRINSRPAQ